MSSRTRKAFTLLELIFVLVIIGILSAIAVPKFQGVAEEAYISKASNVLASVRTALSTERQKRILRGDTAAIGDLGNVFTNFSAAADGTTPKVLQYPPKVCVAGDTSCWTRVSAVSYRYTFPDATTANFTLAASKLDCAAGAVNLAQCAKLEH